MLPLQEGLDEPPDHGKGAGTAGRHADGGEGPLVPEEEVAAQAEEDRDAQQDEPAHPDQFPGFAVSLQQERAEEVDEEKDDRQLRPPVVQGAEEPPHVQLGDDLDDALVGEIDVGDIVEGQEHPGQKLEHEQEKGDPAGVVPEVVTVLRDRLALGQLRDLSEVVAVIQPVFKPWAAQP